MRNSPAERRWAYFDLADFLLIAEAILGVRAEDLARAAQLNLAASALAAPAAEFGGVEFYPEFPTKAAVLCSHLIRNHPLPDGNKRAGFLCTVKFAERNGPASEFEESYYREEAQEGTAGLRESSLW